MSFNATEFTVFGIPPYVFFCGLGTLFAFLVYNCLLLRSGADIKLGNKAVVFSVPALLIGAKFFGIIAGLAKCIAYGTPVCPDTFLYSGIVFYGGLIFFLLCFLLIIRRQPIQERKSLTDSLTVSIPLFHFFGRIGCFTAGCCYGIPTDCFLGVSYTTWVDGCVDTQTRMPVQLIEAALNIMLFILLLALHGRVRGSLLKIYIMLYSVIRFADEFFRGDVDKNILFGFSAAQLLSVLLAVFAVIIFIKDRKIKDAQ